MRNVQSLFSHWDGESLARWMNRATDSRGVTLPMTASKNSTAVSRNAFVDKQAKRFANLIRRDENFRIEEGRVGKRVLD
jgi:hypothetical protein